MKIEEINLKDIDIKDNIRIKESSLKIDELMQSVRNNGLLQPIGVKRISDNSYKLLWGYRRFLACQKLGFKTIPAVILIEDDEEMTEEDFYVINAIENMQRSDNSIMEIGRICAILRKTMSISEIAVRLSKPQSLIKLALNDFSRVPPKYRDKIASINGDRRDKKGKIPLFAVAKVSRLRHLSEKDKEMFFEKIMKDELSIEKINMIASLYRNGTPMNEAIVKSEQYIPRSLTMIFNEAKLEELMRKGEFSSFAEFIIDAVNYKYPKLAIKNINR